MDLDFLPKPLSRTLKAVGAVIAVVLATMAASTWLDALIVTKATAASRDAVQELKTDVKEIRQDSKFTRCALLVHMARGSDVDLMKCDEHK